MKRFKFIFFLYLIALISIAFYLDRTDNLSLKLVDAVYSENDISRAVKLEKAILDLGMKSEEDITTKISSDGDNFRFNTITLSNNNDKSTINLKLSNKYSDKKINMEIKCSTTSNSISVYPDQNSYTIGGNQNTNVLINVQLNKHNLYNDVNVDFQCEMISSLSSNGL